MLAAITTELLIVIKFGKNMFPKPFPPLVIVGWAIFVMVVVGYAVYKFIIVDALRHVQVEDEDASITSLSESVTSSRLRQRRNRISYKE